jgi:hypothetical protein
MNTHSPPPVCLAANLLYMHSLTSTSCLIFWLSFRLSFLPNRFVTGVDGEDAYDVSRVGEQAADVTPTIHVHYFPDPSVSQ